MRDLKFSPDGDFLAVAAGRKLQVWHSPSRRREFTPFSLHRTYAGHHDDIRGVAWCGCTPPPPPACATAGPTHTKPASSLHHRCGPFTAAWVLQVGGQPVHRDGVEGHDRAHRLAAPR